MLGLESPWSLLWLAPVAGAAAWTLRRAARRVEPVSSLLLWRRATRQASPAAGTARRRVTLSWLLLLGGALAAGGAAAGPVWHSDADVRRVAVAVNPSAEFAADDAASLRATAASFLDRLAANDRVQLILPDELGGSGEWLSVAEARAAIARVHPLPLWRHELSLPEPDCRAQHVYIFRAAAEHGAPREFASPHMTLVEIPGALPDVRILAAGIVLLDGADAPGRAELFLRISGRGEHSLMVTALNAGGQQEELLTETLTLAEDETSLVRELPFASGPPPALAIGVGERDGTAVGRVAYFALAPAGSARVAMVGEDCPPLRRFVQVHPHLEWVGEASEADLVIACGCEPPLGKAAVVVDPPGPPPGWSAAGELPELLDLGGADVAADDPLMHHVELAGVAVRRARTWTPAGPGGDKALTTWGGSALIVRSAPGASAAPRARRVYLAFDLSEHSTNFALAPSFVVFLANAVEWLARPDGAAAYAKVSPAEAGLRADWTPVGDAPWRPAARVPDSGVVGAVWPGVYADEAGVLHAVSLLAPRAAGRERRRAESFEHTAVGQIVAAAPLPEPSAGEEIRLRLPLIASAATIWVVGWAISRRCE